MPGSWGTCPGPRVQDSCLRVRRTGCQGLRVGERWPGFQALRTGRKEHLVSTYCVPITFCCPCRPHHGPECSLAPSCRGVSGLLDRNKAFSKSAIFPHKGRKCASPVGQGQQPLLYQQDCQAVPGRGAWGSHHVQNSCVLKHLPSSRLTTPPITSAANTVNVKPRACKTGLRQSQGRW